MMLENSLYLPHTNENAALEKIIRGSIRRKGLTGVIEENPATLIPWSASFFFLDKSRLFNKSSLETQHKILQACNAFNLSELYFIEKAGLAYCAKMILLGETTEIRQIYSLIASDEAVHVQWLSPFVDVSLRTAPQGKLLHLISQAIEQCNANLLYYLVQTILEGWALTYYKTLSVTCQDAALKSTLLNIVKDEALHHKTGIALFDPQKLTAQDEIRLYEKMQAYANILRSGADNIVNCFEKVLGPLSLSELDELFEDLQTELTSLMKLSLLKHLMNQPSMEKFICRLEDGQYFTPYSAKQCAAIYYQERNLL